MQMSRTSHNINSTLSLIKRMKNFALLVFALLTLISNFPNAQTVVDSIKRAGLWPAGLAVYETGNKLCVFDDRTNHLLIYDENSFSLIKEIVFSQPIDDPNSFDDMVVDETKEKLFICLGIGIWPNKGVMVAVVDLLGDSTITEILLPDLLPQSANKFIYDQTINKIYVGSKVIDLASFTVSQNTLGVSGLLNPLTHEVFSPVSNTGKLKIINLITEQVTEVDAITNVYGIGLNWIENKIYLVTHPYAIWLYDHDTGEKKWLVTHNDSDGLYFNPGGNNMYSSAEIACRTSIINGSDDSFFNLQVDGGDPAIGFRYATRHTYFVNHNHIGVYDEISQMFEKIEFHNPHSYMTSGQRLIAVNQTTGRIYATFSSGYNAPDYSPIWILQDSEMFTRPNVFLSDNYSLGYYPPIEILDPLTHNLVEYWEIQYDLRGIAFRSDGGRTYLAVDKFGAGHFEVHAGSGAWDLFGRGAGNYNALVGSLELGNVNPRGVFTSPEQPLVYVACSGTNKLKIIDVSNDTLLSVINEMDVGTNPKSGAITLQGYRGFVTNTGSNDVTVFQAQTNIVIDTIPVGTAPWGIAINPGGRFVYVANSGSNTVSVIDVNALYEVKSIGVGSTPHNIVFSQDGKYAFVTNNGDGTVSVIDAGTHTVINTLTVNPHPDGICAYPDGSRIYVATDSVASIISLPGLSVSKISYNSTQGSKKTITAVANPTSRFAGQITYTNGVAAPNVSVKVFQGGIEKDSAITNASGDYCIYNLMKGSYDIEATLTGYNPVFQSNAVESGQTVLFGCMISAITPGIPVLASPPNNAVNMPLYIEYIWNHATNSPEYNLEISTDSTFISWASRFTLSDTTTTISATPGTKYYWRVRGMNGDALGDWSEVWNFTVQDFCKDIILLNGWNIVSIPVSLNDYTLAPIFPDAISQFFGYNNGYVTATAYEQGKGYWLKYPFPDTITLCGYKLAGDISLSEGWNIVGIFDNNYLVSNLVTIPSGIITSSFYGYNNGYVTATTLESGKGYWVKTNQAGYIVYPALQKNKTINNLEITINKEWPRIELTDAKGKKGILYLTNSSQDLNKYELPPLPPKGIFDFRFTTDRFVEELNSVSKEIKISSAEFPVTLKVTGTELKISDLIGGKIINAVLKNGESIIIDNSTIEVLRIEGKSVPTEFALYQNYPNPFNPVTKIKYAIPVDSRVRIAVYNLLGEEVKKIVNQNVSAGYNEVEFDASNFSSGIYLYRIEANEVNGNKGFSTVKKMVVIK